VSRLRSPTWSAKGLLQRSRRVQSELGCGIEVAVGGRESMDHPGVAVELDRDAGGLELRGVGLALVPEGIAFGCGDEGGREAAKVLVQQPSSPPGV